MADLTKKQRRNLEYLAETIQAFIVTEAKPKKRLKCTSKKDFTKNIIASKAHFDYLINILNANLAILDLTLELQDTQEEQDYDTSLPDITTIDGRTLTLKLTDRAIRANKRLKLHTNYQFVYDFTKQQTYFVVKQTNDH